MKESSIQFFFSPISLSWAQTIFCLKRKKDLSFRKPYTDLNSCNAEGIANSSLVAELCIVC